jgi:hypothetical protein
MLPLLRRAIEDLGQGDIVKIKCAACHHVALLTPECGAWPELWPRRNLLWLHQRQRMAGQIE